MCTECLYALLCFYLYLFSFACPSLQSQVSCRICCWETQTWQVSTVLAYVCSVLLECSGYNLTLESCHFLCILFHCYTTAIISVHGGLSVLPNITQVDDPTTLPQVLVLSGGQDDTSTQVMDLEHTLNATGATWEITRYSGIEHAWTVFGGDSYNEWADQRYVCMKCVQAHTCHSHGCMRGM
jgi:hypothetical protein